MIKKILSGFLVIFSLFFLFSCGGSKNESKSLEYYKSHSVEFVYSASSVYHYYNKESNEPASIETSKALIYKNDTKLEALPELSDEDIINVYYEVILSTYPLTIKAMYIFIE